MFAGWLYPDVYHSARAGLPYIRGTNPDGAILLKAIPNLVFYVIVKFLGNLTALIGFHGKSILRA
jgi:hypothetical protein